MSSVKELMLNAKKAELEENEKNQQRIRDNIKYSQGELDALINLHNSIEHQIEELEKAEVPEGTPTFQFGNLSYLPKRLAKEANEWICKHEMAHHPNHFYGYDKTDIMLKAGPLDYPSYEISISPSNVGDLAGITCTRCKKNFFRDKPYSYRPTDKERDIYYQYLGEI